MGTFILNGTQANFEPGQTILKAAKANGVKIPHFCSHSFLSIDGSCRICLVEVGKMPKLVIACNTKVVQEMIVKTDSERVLNARKAVLELLLINHPLDCPICDQAGECKLQRYAYQYGIAHSRFSGNKRSGRKRLKIGPQVMFDEERCILCRRCVRFCREVTKTGELGVLQRGDKSCIDIFPGQAMINDYSINTADICPVGALTSIDFRFKVRAWFLTETNSVCPACSNNCSIKICHHDGKIYRLLPRKNKKVNQAWMCDHGRLSYKLVHADNRLSVPMVKKNGSLVEVSWDEALKSMVNRLRMIEGKKIGGIASPHNTNEECFLFFKLIKQVLGSRHIHFYTHRQKGDTLLIKEEKAANPQGAREISLEGNGVFSEYKLPDAINRSIIKALYIVGHDIVYDPDISRHIHKVLSKLEFLVVQDTHMTDLCSIADIVLPAATFAEKEGTFTNINGIVQQIKPAVPLCGQAKSDLEIFAQVAEFLEKPFSATEPKAVMGEISRTIEAYCDINYEKLTAKGKRIKQTV